MSSVQVAAISTAYRNGEKLRVIEETNGVTRSQVYWALGQSGLAPQRVKLKSRLDDGNPETVTQLYATLDEQSDALRSYDRLVNLLCEALGESVVRDAVAHDSAAASALEEFRS